MKFEIGFNNLHDKNDCKEFYDFIGARVECKEEFDYYEIEIKSFGDLEALLTKINSTYKTFYSIVMDFNNPCIYLDDKC